MAEEKILDGEKLEMEKLENVAGGTQWEVSELSNTLPNIYDRHNNVTRPMVGFEIRNWLKEELNIDATLNYGQVNKNAYTKNGQNLSHGEVMSIIHKHLKK